MMFDTSCPTDSSVGASSCSSSTRLCSRHCSELSLQSHVVRLEALLQLDEGVLEHVAQRQIGGILHVLLAFEHAVIPFFLLSSFFLPPRSYSRAPHNVVIVLLTQLSVSASFKSFFAPSRVHVLQISFTTPSSAPAARAAYYRFRHSICARLPRCTPRYSSPLRSRKEYWYLVWVSRKITIISRCLRPTL